MGLSFARAMLSAVAVAVVASAVIGSAADAAPPAPTLPPGDSLFTFPYADDQRPPALLLSLDPRADTGTAAGTAVGSGTPTASRLPGQAAWNPLTERAYWFSREGVSTLYSLDVRTGLSTRLAETTESGEAVSIDSLAIDTTGRGFAFRDGALYRLDLLSGALSLVGPTGPSDITGLAFDLASGVLYGIDLDADLFTLDPATGAVTSTTRLQLPRVNLAYALQVDSDGVLWIVHTGDYDELATVDPSAPEISYYAGVLEHDGGPIFPRSLLIVPGTAPIFTSPAGLTVAAGEPFRFAVTADGRPTPTFSISSGRLPDGVTFDTATGVLSGTALEGATVTLAAANSAGTVSQDFRLTVSPTSAAAPTPAPVLRVALPIVSG